MNRLGQWWKKEKGFIIAAVISILLIISIAITLGIMAWKVDENNYYSYSTIVIGDKEYQTKDTKYKKIVNGHLTIELKDGTRIETSDYILKK
jgi:uncharacterized membrane protein YccF (DUF307 family)